MASYVHQVTDDELKALKGDTLRLYKLYLNRQKIPGWKMSVSYLASFLEISQYAVRKARKWLVDHGYAAYIRLKDGKTQWTFFASKKVPEQATTPAIIPRVEIPNVAFEHVLKDKRLREIKEQQHQPIPEITPGPITESVVVVDDSELIYPEQLKPEQKKAARHIIKKVKQPELQQQVLFALAYAMTHGKITSSVPGYLQALVTRANNGTFEPIGGAERTNKPIIPIWQGFADSTPSKPETAQSYIKNLRQSLRL